jgi:DNA-binding MarR family transcriptional regulator
MMAPSSADEPDVVADVQIHAVMRAAQALVGIAVSSLNQAEGTLSLPQLRVLGIVADRGPLNVNTLAAAARIHPSNATRACDPLVARRLLTRSTSPTDRRQVQLAITTRGREVLRSILRHREAATAEILGRMTPAERTSLVTALETFARAAGETAGAGWQWTPPIA